MSRYDMRTLRERDAVLRCMWAKFSDVPMDPKTECIEEAFQDWPAGTPREDIWHWFDERYSRGVTHLLYAEDDRTYTVTEMCPHCESEIEMRWDTDTMGFKAFCPVCGERLMLCDECRHAEDAGPCDYDSVRDCCHKNPPTHTTPARREVSAITLRVETPLGAIIARSATDPNHPGIYVDLRRGADDPDMPLALVEFAADEADLPEAIITRVWGDAMQEDYTTRVEHQNIEQHFSQRRRCPDE